MKYITGCIKHSEGYIYSAYIYSDMNRHGYIRYNSMHTATTGTFDISLENSTLIVSNYTDISVLNINQITENRLNTHSTVDCIRAKYDNGIVNYKHATSDEKIFSVGQGVYSEIDMGSGTIATYNYYCNGSRCIHDILSVEVDSRLIYMGCDMGCLSYIDRRTHETVHEERYTGGITWLKLLDSSQNKNSLGKTEGLLEVGTYTGEYSVVLESNKLIHKKLNGIIWRIHKIELNSTTYNVIAQSYDGVGVYTEDMKKVYTAATDDLVYTVEIDKLTKKVTGYNYYKGTLIEFNLYDVIQEGTTESETEPYR